MEIQINDNYRITSDKFNFILQEKSTLGDKTKDKDRIGDTVWNDCGFFPNLKPLYDTLIKKQIRESELTEFKELVEQTQKLHNEFMESCGKYIKLNKGYEEE